MIKKTQTATSVESRAALKVGYVPLTDCAPLVMAQELGLFNKYGLRVSLSRELGWATIRDKVIHRELDAAHAIAAMPVAATLGLGSVRCDCLTGLVLNLHGNAITLSNQLWQRGVRDAATLRDEIFRSRGNRTFTFGVVYPYSSHHFLLRSWLSSVGIHPDRDVRIVVVPPPQMAANLKAGHLDGFCVGEPWNSVAVKSKAGWCVAVSAELDPLHPEKVLMVRSDFAAKNADDHVALVAAILEACEYCDAAENRDHVITTLALPRYLGVAAESLRPGFDGQFDFGHGRARTVSDFTLFHRHDANEPSGEKAAWVIQHLRDSGLCKDAGSLNFSLGRAVFRTDIFEKAIRLRRSPSFSSNHHSNEQPNTETNTALV